MQRKKINAFIYGRLDSSRFPRKTLAMLGDFTLLELLFERSKGCHFNDCYLLTSDRAIDDDLCHHADEIGLKYIRGDAYDLTQRTKKAIAKTDSEYFMRLNGDSPFIEPSLINFAVKSLGNAKFVSNIFHRTFPYGVAVEIINSEFYLASLEYDIQDSYLEHVTKHLYELRDQQGFVSIKQDTNQANFQLVVDEPWQLKDLELSTAGIDLIKCHYWEILGLQRPRFVKQLLAEGKY